MTRTTPPYDVLAGQPDRTDPRLSPDGHSVAFLAPRADGAMNLFVAPVKDLAAARALTDVGGTGLRPTHGWSYDGDRVVFALDQGGNELFHIYAVDAATGESRDLTPFDGVHARVAGASPRRPDEVLLALNKDEPTRLDYYRAHLRTGDLELVMTGRGHLAGFTDGDLQPRGGVRFDDTGAAVVELGRDGEFHTMLTLDADDVLALLVIPQPGMTVAGDAVHLLVSAGGDTIRLIRIDAETGEVTVVVEDPGHDVEAVFVDPATRAPLAVAIAGDRRRWQAVDPALQRDLDVLADADHDVLEITSSLDGDRWLAALGNPAGPMSYRLLERSTGHISELFCDRPRLRDFDLGQTEPFTFTSRDGLAISGYVTYPPGADRSGLPAVLYVHGGPWGRDGWWWDPSRQLLATRGYACIQVNYRGSTGSGRAFVNAGDREWGARMQDDLHDAVAYLAGRGVVDADRVAIYGGSYGGYAALVGATFTPDAFKAAISWVPPVNLVTLIRSFPPYWSIGLDMWKRRVGDPDTEPDFLLSRSPLTRAGDLRIPLLLVQGENDPRCPPSESGQLVAALQERGIPHTYIVVPDEGHGFIRPENNVALLGWIDEFLTEHLPPLTGTSFVSEGLQGPTTSQST